MLKNNEKYTRNYNYYIHYFNNMRCLRNYSNDNHGTLSKMQKERSNFADIDLGITLKNISIFFNYHKT